MGKLFVGTCVAAVTVVVALFDKVLAASSKIELTVGDLTDAMVKYPPMNGTVVEEEEFA
jgi:hypothetical protein